MTGLFAILLGFSIGVILLGFITGEPLLSVFGLVAAIVMIVMISTGPKSKREICEENLPRNQKCVVQWVPEPVK